VRGYRRHPARARVDAVGDPGAGRDYLGGVDEPIGPRLARVLDAVRVRTRARIGELEALLSRIVAYQTDHADELSGRADFRVHDPAPVRTSLDSPPGGRP